MPSTRIDEIFAAAKAAANCMKLPEHVRSLAGTIEQMASRAAAEAQPDPATIHTLEQAIGILERSLAGYDLGDAALPQSTARTTRRQAETTAHRYPPQFPTL